MYAGKLYHTAGLAWLKHINHTINCAKYCYIMLLIRQSELLQC